MAQFIFVLRFADSKDVAEWNRSLKFFEKVFILYWLFPLSQASFPAKSNTAIIERWFSSTITGETYRPMQAPWRCLLLFISRSGNWKIILTCYSKIWNKRRQITASLKWDPSWEMRSSKVFVFFSPVEKEYFRENWHFPEESLGNRIWNCVYEQNTQHFGQLYKKNKIWRT